MSTREKRTELITAIQQIRNSKVIVYATADRGQLGAQVAEDAVRPLYNHLTALDGSAERIDLFLYSRGGNVSVPWRVVTMFREFCTNFGVLIPYKAYSAATMITLGADEIVMGSKAELGPIDPTLMRATGADQTTRPSEISVEDVSSYISFMSERAGITDQSALAQVVSQLAAQVTPLALGSVNRQYSHIRLVARKLLTSRREKIEEGQIAAIIDALTEKMYSHGHGIGRREAIQLGLPVVKPSVDLESAIWGLYIELEDMLGLNAPFDPEAELIQRNSEESTLTDVDLAVIESTSGLDAFRTNLIVKRHRRVPPNPQISVNLNVPNLNVDTLPGNVQAALQQLLGQILPAVQQIILGEICRQSPIIGVEVRPYGGKWVALT